jgi:hypothetical protein
MHQVGEKGEWILELQSGQSVRVVANSEQDVELTIRTPAGRVFLEADNTSGGDEVAAWQADTAGPWMVEVREVRMGSASYAISWSSPEAGAGEQLMPAIPQGDATEVQPAGGAGARSTLDLALEFLAGTLVPFLALLAVQGIAVFMVLRFMMRPSTGVAPEPNVDAEPVTPRVPGGGSLSFVEVGPSNGVVLSGEAYQRYRHSRESARRTWLGFCFALIGFLLVSWVISTVLESANPVPTPSFVLIAQAVVGVILMVIAFVRFQSTGDPVSSWYATGTVLALLIPAAVAAGFGSWQNLAVWPLIPAALWYMLRAGGRRAGRFGKQDLLVLRVFGADASAVSTFGTVARAWRHLGPTITIADPSYVRYEFSATSKGRRWKFMLLALAYGVVTIGGANPAIRSVIAGIPWFAGLTDAQLANVALAVGVALLVPFAALPVFVSAFRNFSKDRESLLQSIGNAMGANMRWNGVYTLRPYYCYDDLWRPAVQRMMEAAEVVLMDFRGFNPSKRGCEYEIGKALDAIPIHRLVLLLDDRTDRESIFMLFRERWASLAQLSPGVHAVDPTLKVVTARAFVSWRDGIWQWIKSLWRREARWREDAERILALIAAAPTERGAVAIP